MAAWARRKDIKRALEIIAYQDAPSPPMTPELREKCHQALYVVTTRGEILSAGRATLFVLDTIGAGGPLPRILTKPPFIWLIEIGYRIVARNRSFFSRFLFTKKQMGEKEIDRE